VTPGKWTLIGAHGGAGVSTVVALLNHRVGAGEGPPVAREFDSGWDVGRRPVVVTRSTAAGAELAAQMMAEWPLPDRPVLMVVADAPLPVPPLARHRLQVISAQAAGTLSVPYLHPVRNLGDPAVALGGRSVARVARRLQRQLEQMARTGGS
jgi:hypothetical protein